MSIKSCRVCGSYAINEHLHGRIPGAKPDLCDVCYWREVANSLGFHVALVPMSNEEMEDLNNGTYINPGIIKANDGFSNNF